MTDFLVQQAIQNIWCTPTQDQQQIIKLAKITRFGGVYSKVQVIWRQYSLPLPGTLFHVYQIGGISPSHLGLRVPQGPGVWVSMADSCMSQETIIDLYNINGIQSPRVLAWYTVTADGDLIVAVQHYQKVAIDYNTEDLFMRVYHNAYYGSDRRNNAVDFIEVAGGIMRNTDAILALQNKFQKASEKGTTYAFVNGYLVPSLNMLTVAVDDVAEYVYDGSIYSVEELQVSDLSAFDSTLDLKRKYLLHPATALKTTITYQDDIDFFIYKKDDAGRFQGLYFHRNAVDAVRMVTHADYAITLTYLAAYAASQEGWTDLNDLTIRMQMRKSGWRRPLINESNRIRELYKLPDSEILEAMIGIGATVPEWTAAHLEASGYTKVMRSSLANITPTLTQDALGYNAMASYLAPTPQFTKNVSGDFLVDIPLNLQYRSTVYEFDFQGLLLGWYLHTQGAVWRTQNASTHLVQIISGYGTTRLDERYGARTAAVDATLDYRMYSCAYHNGLPDNIWQDVTGSSAYVIGGVGNLNWVTPPSTTYTMVRSNRDFLGYDLLLPIQSGVLKFVLTSEQDRGTGFQNTLMQVPMGELDLFMNGRALVEDIDYFVRFPEVIIVNKKFIDHGAEAQKITIRFCGHSQANMERAVYGDRGFVSHGVLSNNDRFDVRDGKVLHIAVGGAVYDRTELKFAETSSAVIVPGVENGSPYVVRDIVVPMRGTTNAKTYELRDAALLVDKHVSDYLTTKLPPPTFTDVDVIPSLYPVYSPFCSALIDDLKNGILTDARINEQYNDDTLRDMCKFYEQYLEFEPTRAPNTVDPDYVSVQAYYKDVVTDLTLFQYRFLSRAVSLYLNNAVVLSHYVTATV